MEPAVLRLEVNYPYSVVPVGEGGVTVLQVKSTQTSVFIRSMKSGGITSIIDPKTVRMSSKDGPTVSFKVLFQCKRYQGSVSAQEIRIFQAAMMGRASKGIFITTGNFTLNAKKESLRDGVPPLELVDGEKLVEMFEFLELGLIPKTEFDIDFNFFEDFKE